MARKVILFSVLVTLLLVSPCFAETTVILSDVDRNVAKVTSNGRIFVNDTGKGIYNAVLSNVSSVAAVQLSYSSAVKSVTILGIDTNRCPVYIGTSSVSASNGIPISTTTVLKIDTDDCRNIYAIGDNRSTQIEDNGIAYLAVLQ